MENELASKELSHLGLVAGMIYLLGIVEGIDSKVEQDLTDRHVSIGLGVKAMFRETIGEHVSQLQNIYEVADLLM